jgi:hypothetical protein
MKCYTSLVVSERYVDTHALAERAFLHHEPLTWNDCSSDPNTPSLEHNEIMLISSNTAARAVKKAPKKYITGSSEMLALIT